jgi:hypothetical protein
MARYHVLDDPLNPLPYAGAHLFPGLLPLLPLSVRHLLWLPALNLYTTLVTGPRHIR